MAEVQTPQASVALDREVEKVGQAMYSFNFSDFLRREYRFGLDPNRPMCKSYMQGHCPLGPRCPDRHDVSSSFGGQVCKHWLRGLCKRGEECDYLHQYNLRRMPECSHYARNQTCSNGDDCLYVHIDPEAKRPSCPHYDRGFCPLGPHCALKHNKKEKICPFYLCGFCPEGKNCKNGAHARFPTDLKKPEVRVEKSPEELEAERIERERDAARREGEERERDDRGGYGGGRGFRGSWDHKKRGGRRGRGRGRGRGDF